MNKHKKVTCERVSAVLIRKPIYDKREFMVSFYITLILSSQPNILILLTSTRKSQLFVI